MTTLGLTGGWVGERSGGPPDTVTWGIPCSTVQRVHFGSFEFLVQNRTKRHEGIWTFFLPLHV